MNSTNPYAPPAADVTPPAVAQEPAVPRPLSVRWALVFLTLGILVGSAVHLLTEQMLAKFHLSFGNWYLIGFLAAQVIPNALPLAFLLFAGRRPVAYWVTVMALGWICCSGLFSLGSHVASEELPERTSLKMLMVFALVTNLLTAWFFYCFTFSRPSREYFRMVK